MGLLSVRGTSERVRYGGHRSYSALGSEQPAYDLGLTMGANPIPIAAPCHRVTRGIERPATREAGRRRPRAAPPDERD